MPDRLALAPLMRFFFAYIASKAVVLAAIALKAILDDAIAAIAVEDDTTALSAVLFPMIAAIAV